MLSFKNFRKQQDELETLPVLDQVFISRDGINYQTLNESRNWVDGRFKGNVGIDQPTSGAGQRHAHVYGRKGEEILAVNVDGTASHGTKGRLHPKDAEALTGRGFKVRRDRVVEWTLCGAAQLLLG